jgi:hypothetical protein
MFSDFVQAENINLLFFIHCNKDLLNKANQDF